jgi:hypothetical protein
MKLRFVSSSAVAGTVLASLLALASAPTAWGYGLKILHLPPVPPAPTKIVIDGNLDDWKGLDGFSYVPVGGEGGVTRAAGDPSVAALLKDPASATIKLCYDADALYVAVRWKDTAPGKNKTAAGDAAHWADGGEGVALHILGDRTLHVACWPTDGGKSVAIMAQRGADPAWKDAGPQITAGGAPVGKDYGAEIRIPWSEITSDGHLPGNGKLELGADLAWNAIDFNMVQNLRNAAFSAGDRFAGVPFCFLTSHPMPLGTPSLQNTFEWGELVATSTPQSDLADQTPEQTTLRQMPLLQAQSAPTMDGTLASWDPKQFQTAALLPGFWGTRYQCQLAAQYDNDNLYLAAHFMAGPSYSNVMPEKTQQGYTGGDALQFRIGNGTKSVNLCGWFDSAGKQPALTADGKNLDNAFLLQQGAQEVFKPDADNQGYVQEITVPWSVLFGSAPSANAHLKATFQPWFADMTNIFSVFAQLSLERKGAIPITFKMPADGQVTVGLFDKDGSLLKWLLQDEFRYQGEHTLYWDGLDQYGNPVDPGDYTVKTAYHPPITTDYKMTLLNPGNPPWPTPDDKGDWLNDEATPQAVATDGKWVFLGSPGNEKGCSVIGLDETGQRQWSFNIGSNPRGMALAVDGDDLYILYSGPELTDDSWGYNGHNAIEHALLMCVNKKTGKPASFTVQNPRLEAATWPYKQEVSHLWDLRNNKSFTPFNYGGQPRYFRDDIGESTGALSLAVLGDKIYISMDYENKLLAVDKDTGTATGDDIPLPSPAGLCPLNDHTLLAVSGTQVVTVDVGNKSVLPAITSDLVAPDSIAVDKQGTIYVSDWGTSFQVKAFDSAGHLLRAIGKPGGRPWVGKWDPNGMLVPRGIGVDDQGRLWVAEDDATPKRISVWNSQTGAFLKDYIGPTPYGGGTFFWMDPKDPTIAHGEGASFKLDFDKKTYTPLAIDYRQSDWNSPFTPNGHNLDGFQVRVLNHDGKEYTLFKQNPRFYDILQKQADGIYQPVAAFGSFGDGEDSDSIRLWDSDIKNNVYTQYYPPVLAGRKGQNFSWTDTNGDHEVQEDELHFVDASQPDSPQGNWGTGWNLDVSSDFTFYFWSRHQDQCLVYRLPVKGWTPAGAPIYDMNEAQPFIYLKPKQEINGLRVTQDKKLVIAFSYEGDGPVRNPNMIECYDLDGKKLWGFASPKTFTEKTVHANCVGYDYMLPGLGDVVCTWLYHGDQRPYFFTTDGLYVGTALDDTLLGPTAIWSESARYFYQTPDGTPYIINGANDQEHIFKLGGLQTGGRTESAFTLTQEDAQRAADERQIPEQKAAPKPVIKLAWLTKPPTLDGDLSDWNMNDGVTMDGGGGRTATVALGRDQANLYLAYSVHEPTAPLVNGGNDWHTLFATGDCVDLMLATDKKADPNRRGPAAGDERLLFALYQGKPVAVLYRPVVPGTTAPVRLGSESVDQIVQLSSAQVQMKRDGAHGSYTVEASVPLADLHIDPKETDALKGDVGVVYADDSGRSRALRLYYYNKDTQMIADIPTEARLQPADWGDIEFPLGPNLLQNGSFEGPFVDSTDDPGWVVSSQRNGADLDLVSDWVYCGQRSALLEMPTNPYFPEEEYADPDKDNFYRSENHGQGNSNVELRQKVPVVPGHLYSIRYRVRATGMMFGRDDTGHPRGYVHFSGGIDWDCAAPNPGQRDGMGEVREDHDDWFTLYNYRHGYDLPTPFEAPDGAVSATLIFNLDVNAADDLFPRVYLDDVEFVDVTPSS